MSDRSYQELIVWFLGIAGLAVTIAAFYPGYVTHDGFAQYMQVKAAVIYNHHPPIMVYLWRALDKVIEGSGGIFLFHNILYWLAVTIIARRVSDKMWLQIIAVMGIGFFPPTWVIMGQVLKDAGVLVSFLLSVAMLLEYHKNPHKGLLVVAVVALFYGSAVRHNSFLAAIPLLFYIACLVTSVRWKRWSAMLALVLAMQSGIYVVNKVNVQNVALWPSLAVWDMAAISLAEDKMLLPDYIINQPNFNMERLKEIYSDTSNPSLCAYYEPNGREVLCREAFEYRRGDGLKTEDLGRLFQEWMRVVTTYPISYIEHRIKISLYLLGVLTPEQFSPFFLHTLTDEQFKNASFKELGITIAFEQTAFNVWVKSLFNHLKDSIFFKGWLYVVLMVIMLGILLKHYKRPLASLGLAIGVSGVLYVAPLAVLTASADFRYLIWLLGAVMVLVPIVGKILLQSKEVS